jgi:hypothetical protein
MTALLDRIKARAGTGGGGIVDRIKVRASGGADPQEEVQGGLRFQLRLFGDTLEEQKATFKKAFPEGELIEMQVAVSPTGEISSYRGGSQEEILAREGPGVAKRLVYKTGPGEPFKRLDEDAVKTWARILSGDVGRGLREIGADVGEFIAGDLPEIVAETALAIATKGRSLPARLGLTTIAGGTAETWQQLSQTIYGTQRDTLGEQVDRALGATAWAAAGAGASEAIPGSFNRLRKVGVLKLQRPGLKATASAKRLNIAMMAHQVSDVPAITRLANQARAVLPLIARYQAKQAERVQRVVRGLIDFRARSQFIQETAQAFSAGAQAIRQMVGGSAEHSPNYGGEAIRDGIQTWNKAAETDVNLAHTVARRMWKDLDQAPVFDGTDILKTIDELEQGTRISIEQTVDLPESAASGIPQMRGPADFQGAPLERELQILIDNIKKIDYSKITSPDQLAVLERALHDLMLAPIEGAREPQKQARKLFGAIRRTLDNPQNNASGAVDAWKSARKMAAERFLTQEKLAAINIAVNPQIAPKESATALAQRLVGPNQMESIRLVRHLLQSKAPQKWADFKQAAKTLLLDEAPHKALERIDERTLRALLDPAEMRVFKEAGRQSARLESTGIKVALEQQTTIRGFTRQLINTNKTESIDAMFELVQRNGGKESTVGKSFQAAIIDEIHERVATVFKGEGAIDATGLREVLKEFNDKGLLKFLNGGQKRMLADVRTVTDFMRGSADVGASMHGAATSRGMAQLKFSAFRIFLENVTLGRILTSKWGRRILTGGQEKATKFYPTTRIFTLAANEIATDAENNKATGEAISEFSSDIMGIPIEMVRKIREFGRGAYDARQ